MKIRRRHAIVAAFVVVAAVAIWGMSSHKRTYQTPLVRVNLPPKVKVGHLPEAKTGQPPKVKIETKAEQSPKAEAKAETKQAPKEKTGAETELSQVQSSKGPTFTVDEGGEDLGTSFDLTGIDVRRGKLGGVVTFIIPKIKNGTKLPKNAKKVVVRDLTGRATSSIAAKVTQNVVEVPPGPGAVKVFLWKTVGGDPCNPKAGCTLDWALRQTRWPSEVQKAFLSVVRDTSPEHSKICSGWHGWMSWGKFRPKFRLNTVASWKSGHCEQADRWHVDHEHMAYSLIKVNKCHNWGGEVKPLPVGAPVPVSAAKHDDGPPLGVPPIVSCS